MMETPNTGEIPGPAGLRHCEACPKRFAIVKFFLASRSKLNCAGQKVNGKVQAKHHHIPRKPQCGEKQIIHLAYMKQMGGWVYITCSLNHSTLYMGVTSNIASRAYIHKHKYYPSGFSAKYNCIKLVYYRRFESIIEAIAEEKRIKGGSRKKKEALINSMNPEWRDLYDEVRYL